MEITRIVHTAKSSPDRLTQRQPEDFIAPEGTEADEVFYADLKYERQAMLGFGGAFTEAMADTLQRMPKALAQEAVDAYFHPEKGIGYNFCRSHMNSCDFSLGNYACVEKEGDVELKSFNIDRDRQYLVPLIHQAQASRGAPMKLYISPWSPPAWMKTNGRMNAGGSLKREYYEAWALHFVKFIQAYEAEGIPVWGMSIQNEPLAITAWDNCIYTHAQERDFCKVLAKTLKEHGLGDKKIIVWDHNKDFLTQRVDTIFSDIELYEAVYGVGFHWYGGNDTETTVDNSALHYVAKNYPDKKLIFTEGCNPISMRGKEDLIGEWWTGEKYGMHIIEDLNNFTAAWTDWNMVLDERGGPNHVGNFCDAPIIADTIKGELRYQSPYYYIGHFSKFIQEGAIRRDVRKRKGSSGLYATLVQNPDGDWVLIAMNKTDEAAHIQFELKDFAQTLKLPPRSISTVFIR